MPVLLAVVFVDLLGFGLLLPLFPYVAERLGANAFWVTFGGPGVYALCQLLSAPVWGRLSDAYGRRPILAAGMFGSAVAYLAMAYSDDLVTLVTARAFQGLMAGNLAAAFAYATDASDGPRRAKALGLVGAAFGLGFMLGPAVGGILGGRTPAGIDFALPALVAAAASLVAGLGVLLFLPESHSPARGTRPPPAPRRAWSGRGVLVRLLACALVVQVAATLLQAVYPLWAHAVHGHGPLHVGYAYFALGLASVACQAAFAGPLVARFGEHRVAAGGVALLALGLVVLAVAHGATLYVGLALYGLGLGAYTPALSSLVAQEAAPHERGALMGTYNAASSAGRIVGPALAGPLYAGHANAPMLSAALLLIPVLLVLRASRSAAGATTPAAR